MSTVTFAQVFIGLFGVSAIWLSQDVRPHVARWGCIAGLCAQPAWFYETASKGQWVIFGLSVLYTLSWCKGVRTHWWRKA